MAIYIVTYDLNKQKNYPKLYDAIKSAGTACCHALDSTWFVESTAGSVLLRNYIVASMDADDSLFVGELTDEAAWLLPTTVSEWLKARL